MSGSFNFAGNKSLMTAANSGPAFTNNSSSIGKITCQTSGIFVRRGCICFTKGTVLLDYYFSFLGW